MTNVEWMLPVIINLYSETRNPIPHNYRTMRE